MDVQRTLRKFFPSMKIHEVMLHILYAKQENGLIEPDRSMKMDYSSVINDLIKMGLITRVPGHYKFTELGLEKIKYLREMRGLEEPADINSA